MNAYDQLLEWASEVGVGTWRGWRDSCAYLGVEPSSAARKLAALGHVEFDWIDDRFAAAPPAAVLTLHSSGCLFLTGGRRRGARDLLERLYEDGDYIDLRLPVEQERGPATWLAEAEIDQMQRFCDDAGFTLQIDSGRRIAEALPRASLELCAEEGRPDPRFARKWFDPKLACLLTNVPPGQDGLWWIEEDRRDVAFVRREGAWFRVPTREYGPYLAYPDRSFISYKKGICCLSVDNRAPLPPLLARAATLQSGRLAKRDGSRHTYINIDDELAELIQEKLDTPLDWQ